MKRREFIKATAASAPMIACFPAGLSGISCEKANGKIEKRSLGKTGEKLSILGFGGVVVKDATPEESAERVLQAIERGINYFDVAPSYGNAEIMLGPALQPYRKNVFLACKSLERQRDGVWQELEQSLNRLHTDHLDLYQLHSVNKMEDVETIFSNAGAIKAFTEARDQGIIRYIGFSSHAVETSMSLMDRFDFDTILFPVNYTTWYAGSFGPQVLAKAQEKSMGILALKAMVKGPWPEGAKQTPPKCWYEPLSDPEEALLGLRFALSHPVTAAIPPGDENLFKMAMGLQDRIQPLKTEEIERIKEKGLKGNPLFKFPTT